MNPASVVTPLLRELVYAPRPLSKIPDLLNIRYRGQRQQADPQFLQCVESASEWLLKAELIQAVKGNSKSIMITKLGRKTLRDISTRNVQIYSEEQLDELVEKQRRVKVNYPENIRNPGKKEPKAGPKFLRRAPGSFEGGKRG